MDNEKYFSQIFRHYLQTWAVMLMYQSNSLKIKLWLCFQMKPYIICPRKCGILLNGLESLVHILGIFAWSAPELNCHNLNQS